MAIAYNPRTVTNGLVLCLDAANPKSYLGSGTAWTDLTGSGSEAVLSGTTSVTADAMGAITMFAAGAGRAAHSSNINAVNAITNSSPFTFSITFRVNSYPAVATGATGGLLQKGSYNPSYGLNLAYAGDSGGVRTQVRVYGGIRNIGGTAGTSGYGLISPTAPTALTLGQWVRADMTHEFAGTTHTIKIYLNGMLDATEVQTSSLFPINFQNSLSIGVNTNILSGTFIASDISVSNYSIYNRALSADEIAQNFDATRGRFGV